MQGLRGGVVVVVAVLFLQCVSSVDGTGVTWTKRNPLVTVSDLDSIVYGNGRYVAIGDGPTVVTSTDLSQWTAIELHRLQGSNIGWYIAFNEKTNTFVAVGGQNPTFTSSDGIDWTIHDQQEGYYLCKMSYGNGIIVSAPLDGNAVYYSYDGIRWNTSQISPYFDVVGVTYANGQFLVYGSDGYKTGGIYSASDAVTWKLFSNLSSLITDPINQIDAVTQGPSPSFLAATVDVQYDGVIVISTDGGKTWKLSYKLQGGYDFGGISYGLGAFYARVYSRVTQELLLSSTDQGKTWNKVSSSTIPGQLLPFPLNNQLVVVGSRGMIMYSADGKTWNRVKEGITDYLQQYLYDEVKEEFYLTFDNQDFTGGGILVTKDGITWNLLSSQVFDFIIRIDDPLHRWAATDGLNIYVSQDMEKWITVPGPNLPPPPDVPDGSGRTYITGIAYGNGIWVAAVNKRGPYLPMGYDIFTVKGYPASPSSWLNVGSSSNLGYEVSSLVYGGGVFLLDFVDMGTNPFAFISSVNGMNWTSLPNLPLNPVGGGRYVGPSDQGYFVYYSYYGAFCTSNDGGKTWHSQRLGTGLSVASIDWIAGSGGTGTQGFYLASATTGQLFTASQLLTPTWLPFNDPLPPYAFGQTGASHVYANSQQSLYLAILTLGNLIYTGRLEQ